MNNNFGDLLIEIGTLIKNYYEKNNSENIKQNTLLKAKDVCKRYPILTNYGLNEAARKGLIPVIKRGKLNFYDSKDIENYIKKLKTTNKEKFI